MNGDSSAFQEVLLPVHFIVPIIDEQDFAFQVTADALIAFPRLKSF